MGRYWILVSGSWIKPGVLFYLSSINHPVSSIASVQQMEYDYAQLVGLRRSFASKKIHNKNPITYTDYHGDHCVVRFLIFPIIKEGQL